MITLSFLKLLQDNSFGTIGQDLFYQEMTLDQRGVCITDIGDPVARHSRDVQSYELFVRGDDKVESSKKLMDIRNFLKTRYSSICELPEYEGAGPFTRVTLTKPSTITSVGRDANEHMVYSIQGSIIY